MIAGPGACNAPGPATTDHLQPQVVRHGLKDMWMLSRRRLLAGLGFTLLVFAVAACQAFPAGEATRTAIPQPTVPVGATPSLLDNVVWARIPYCDCLDGISTDNVSAALKRAKLDGTVKLLN